MIYGPSPRHHHAEHDDYGVRRGITLLDLTVVLVLAVLILLVLLPLGYGAIQRVVRTGCTFNLHSIGVALSSYESAHSGTYPVGSAFQTQPASPWGTSWWVEILSHLGTSESVDPWKQGPSSGSFSLPEANPNYPRVDGHYSRVMACPASPLPVFNDPRRYVSAANRQQLKGAAQGIAVPTYVAIAGSAPDIRRLPPTYAAGPAGRNTRDGPLGILSASGVFPPNRSIRIAALRDGLQFTMLVGEQADWLYDRQFEPAVLYDHRSAWPAGAYTGSGAAYTDLTPTAEGLNGSGEERCFNITTIRYPINHQLLVHGIVGNPFTSLPSRPTQPPRLGPDVAGPGHNQGLFSAHTGGVNVLFADGHVQFLADSTDLGILLRLATRDDGDFVELKPNR